MIIRTVCAVSFAAAFVAVNYHRPDDAPRAPDAGTVTKTPDGKIQHVLSSYNQAYIFGHYNTAVIQVTDTKTASTCFYDLTRNSRMGLPGFNDDFSRPEQTGKLLSCKNLTPAQVECLSSSVNNTGYKVSFDRSSANKRARSTVANDLPCELVSTSSVAPKP